MINSLAFCQLCQLNSSKGNQYYYPDATRQTNITSGRTFHTCIANTESVTADIEAKMKLAHRLTTELFEKEYVHCKCVGYPLKSPIST